MFTDDTTPATKLKRCGKCFEKKPADREHFYFFAKKDGSKGLQSYCIPCAKEAAAAAARGRVFKKKLPHLKYCRKCDRMLPRSPTCFPLRKGALEAPCRRCRRSASSTEWQRRTEADKARMSAWQARWEKNRYAQLSLSERTKYNLKRRYGLTPEAYEKMLCKQKGGCAICRQVPKRFDVDHDHRTGAVRQLLCHRCNWVLGKVGDDQALLAEMIRYLRKHS